MSGEPVANKVISKVYARLKFLQRRNKYLTPNLRRLKTKKQNSNIAK